MPLLPSSLRTCPVSCSLFLSRLFFRPHLECSSFFGLFRLHLLLPRSSSRRERDHGTVTGFQPVATSVLLRTRRFFPRPRPLFSMDLLVSPRPVTR